MRIGKCVKCRKIDEIVMNGLCLSCFVEIYIKKREEGLNSNQIIKDFKIFNY